MSPNYLYHISTSGDGSHKLANDFRLVGNALRFLFESDKFRGVCRGFNRSDCFADALALHTHQMRWKVFLILLEVVRDPGARVKLNTVSDWFSTNSSDGNTTKSPTP